MKMKVIDKNWKLETIETIKEGVSFNNLVIDKTITFAPALTFLVLELSKRDVPYKIYNLGGGVKRITTVTDSCPCCKRKF